MANKKITELDAATSLASTDVVPVVDVSADVTKKITTTDLFRTLPDGTAAAPSLSFASDAGNGVFLAGTDTVGISTGGTQRVTVDGSGNVTISGDLQVDGATTTVQSTTVTIDDKNIELGSVASPSNTTADGGGITLKGATDKTIKWINSTGFWTFNTGIDVGGNIELADNSKIRLGTGDDLEIFHDGSTSFIKDVGTGVLAITSNGGHIALLNGDQTKNLAKFIVDGASELYHNGAKKFETLSTGASVTGNLGIGATNNTSYDASAQNFLVADESGNAGITVRSGGGTPFGAIHFADGTSSNAEKRAGRIMYGHSGDFMLFSTADSEAFRIDSAGRLLVGTTSDVSGGLSTTLIQGVASGGGYVGLARNDSSVADGNGIGGLRFYANDPSGFNDVGIVQCVADGTHATDDYPTRLEFHTTADNASSPTERLRIKSDGTLHAIKSGTQITNAEQTVAVFQRSSASGSTSKISIVSGNAASSHINFGDTDDEDTGMIAYVHSTNAMQFHTNGNAERMRLDSSGHLGIGETAPAADLVVKQSGSTFATASQTVALFQRSSTTGHAAKIAIVGGSLASSDIHFGDTDDEDVGIIHYVHQDNSMRFTVNASERMRITSTGLVNVTGGIQVTENVTPTSGSGVEIFSPSSTVGQVQAFNRTGSAWMDLILKGNTQQFHAAGSEAMRIDASGRLLIGESSAVLDTSNALLQMGASAGANMVLYRDDSSVSADDSLGLIRFYSNAGGTKGEHARITAHADGTSGGVNGNPGRLVFYTEQAGSDGGPVERFRITSTGAWSIEGASNFGTSGQVLTSNGNDAPTWQNPSAGAQISAGNTNVECVDTGSNGHILFDTEGSERMRIDSSGNVILKRGADVGNILQINGADTTSEVLEAGITSGHVQFTATHASGGSNTCGFIFRTRAGLAGTSERMRIDSSGRVLIGATAAANATTLLTVQNGSGDAQITLNSGPTSESVINMGDTGDFNIGAIRYNQTDNAFRFFTSNAERMRITSTGIGIGGVTSPFDKLQVRTATDANFVFSSAGGTEASFEIFNNAGSANTPLNYRASEHKFKIQANEKMRLDSSGRLLLGTSSARQNFYNNTSTPTKFQIEGTSYTSSSMAIVRNSNNGSDAEIVIGKTRSGSVGGYGVVQNGDHIGAISFQGADGSELVEAASILAVVDSAPGSNDMPGRLVFSTTADGAATPTERMRITSGGQVLAGTSSGDGTAHIFAMSAPSSYAFKIHNTNSNNSVATLGLKIKYDVSPNDTNNAIELQVGNGSPFVVRNNGNVQNTNGSFTSFSDARYKENIVDASSQWEDIKNTRIRNWNFRPELGWATHTMLGPVAQELELVSPGLVVDNPVLDDNNNPTGEVQKSVNQSILYMKAVKALQEAMARIEELEAKVAALEAS